MPYKFDTEKKRIPKDKDSRTKLTERDRRMIKLNIEELSQRELAKLYGVDKRTIAFIQNPQQLAANKEARKARGGSTAYYDKAKHAVAMKRYRARKKALAAQKSLI